MAELQKLNLKQLTAKQDDPLGIQLFDTVTRPFWIKKNGTDLDGQHLLAYVIAQQQWISEAAPDRGQPSNSGGRDRVEQGRHAGLRYRCGQLGDRQPGGERSRRGR